MTLTVKNLMAAGVVTAKPEHSVDYVRRQMRTLEIHAVPVADERGVPVGIVRARDLIAQPAADTPVSEVMFRGVLSVDVRTDIHTAAQLMRRQGQHHILVTEDGKIAGIVSAVDFLQLVEGHRFEMKPDEPDFKTGIFYVRPEDLPEP